VLVLRFVYYFQYRLKKAAVEQKHLSLQAAKRADKERREVKERVKAEECTEECTGGQWRR
jgi:hypothetical protein